MRHRQTNDDLGWAILGLGFLAAITIVAWVLGSYMEAMAYNRLTGGNATTLDAMFTELRVIGSEE